MKLKNYKKLKNKKIILLYEGSFTLRDYKRFSIEELVKNGYNILILDITKIMHPQLVFDKIKLSNKKVNLIYCNKIYQFFNEVNNFSPSVCLSYVNPSLKNAFKKLKIIYFLKKRCIYVNHIASIPKSNSFLFKIVRTIFLSPFILLKPHYSYVSGPNSLSIFEGKVIKGHTLDYDLFLKEKNNKKKSLNSPYILFLDENNPFHPDWVIWGENPFDANIYFKELNLIFKKISNNLKLDILIQAHPKANKKQLEKYYNFPLSNSNTASSIKNADLILAHSSTAIQLAVLFKKPIILIESSEIKKHKASRDLLNSYSSLLDVSKIDKENVNLIKEIPVFNNKKYNTFKYEFVKFKGSPSKFSYEIFLDFLANV